MAKLLRMTRALCSLVVTSSCLTSPLVAVHSLFLRAQLQGQQELGCTRSETRFALGTAVASSPRTRPTRLLGRPRDRLHSAPSICHRMERPRLFQSHHNPAAAATYRGPYQLGPKRPPRGFCYPPNVRFLRLFHLAPGITFFCPIVPFYTLG